MLESYTLCCLSFAACSIHFLQSSCECPKSKKCMLLFFSPSMVVYKKKKQTAHPHFAYPKMSRYMVPF